MDEPKRTKFHIHLITVVVLILVTALLLYVNTRPPAATIQNVGEGRTLVTVKWSGWPFGLMQATYENVPVQEAQNQLLGKVWAEPLWVFHFFLMGVAPILVVVALICEKIIRRVGAPTEAPTAAAAPGPQ
jgi:hypothetical protein